MTGSYTVDEEDATLVYIGDTLVTGTSARLAATVTEQGDGGLGDLTNARVTFDVYTGAASCGSGTPTRIVAAVVDTAPAGDGAGSAEATLATPSEEIYCVVVRLTGTTATSTNAWYEATPAQNAVLTIVTSTGKFATGGGWLVDPGSGGRGNFGFTARFAKNGQPKGQAVYVWRGQHGGRQADFIVKSTSITGLSFADELGTGTFPWRATLIGKATIRINRASDGAELYTDGNAAITIVAVDSGANSGTGADTYALRVLDKSGAVYRLVGGWSGAVYERGVLLSGGNVKVHMQ